MFRNKEKSLEEIPARLFEPTFTHTFAQPQETAKNDPETTLGEGVTFKGELTFERLLKIEGTFEGELVSQGKIIVGPRGKVKADINLQSAVVEGCVEGNITVKEHLELRGEAIVYGDIQAKSLTMDPQVTLVGNVNVTPLRCDSH